MAAKITVKRSSVEGKIPLTTDLELGELAVNTYDGKLFLKRNDGTTDYIVEVGGNQGFEVKNQTGSALPKGTLVKFAGTVGNSGKLLVAPFIANGLTSSDYFVGVVLDTIPNGGDGFVIDHGKIYNINTSAYADGTILYASAITAGAFTSTMPEAPNNKITVAAVINSHASAGVLEVRVSLGSQLGNDELVELTAISDDQIIVYNSTNSRFENTSLKTINGTSILGSGNIEVSGSASAVRTVVITDGTSITLDCDTTDIATQANTQAAGTLTINAPSGTPANGQKIMLRLTSTNAQTFSWNSIFTGSTDLELPTASTGSSATDYMGFIYNSTLNKWNIIAKNFGF